MAGSKEGLVIIFDVSQNTRNIADEDKISFFEKEKNCCIEFFQRKILANKKDEVAIILMGTQETDNQLNETLDGYSNIIEAIPMQIPDWDMLISFTKPLEKMQGISGNVDWLDAVILAMDVLKREESKKLKQLKIVMFHSFLGDIDDTNIDMAVEGLKSLDIELVVISERLEYIDDDSKVLAKFYDSAEKSFAKRKSESLIARVTESCDGILCNFDIALSRMLNQLRPKSKPWTWNSVLEIGSKISMQISCIISIKEEKYFQWRKESVYSEANVYNVIEYFKGGEKFDPKQEDLISGYMLGNTPIAYDATLGLTKIPTIKGMKCVAFTQKNNVPVHYFSGTGSYIVLPKMGETRSEKIFNAMVKAMEKGDLVMICRRVYANGNKPKFNVLMPNFTLSVPCLSMFELFFAEQQLHWDFPPLIKRKTQSSQEQYDAVERLIDSMNLDAEEIETQLPRTKYEKECIQLKKFPNLSYEYICQLATDQVLQNSNNLTTSIRGRDTAVKIPQQILEKSKSALDDIKNLFKLEEIKKEGKRELIRHLGDIPAVNGDEENADPPLQYQLFGSISTVKPAQDYLALIERDVENEKDDILRRANFDRWSHQMCLVLNDLIFKSVTQQTEKIIEGLNAYKQQAAKYSSFEYNKWMKSIKDLIILRKMLNFWEEVIVKNKIGLLAIDDDANEEEFNNFYKIDTNIQSGVDDGQANENVDDLFDEM